MNQLCLFYWTLLDPVFNHVSLLTILDGDYISMDYISKIAAELTLTCFLQISAPFGIRNKNVLFILFYCTYYHSYSKKIKNYSKEFILYQKK